MDSDNVSHVFVEWNRLFGRKCVTLSQALRAGKNDAGFMSALYTSFGSDSKPLTSRRLGQCVAQYLDTDTDGLVMTVSHVSSHTSYYQVMTTDEFNMWYVYNLDQLSDDELLSCIENTRGTQKFESIAEKMTRNKVYVALDICDYPNATEGDLVVHTEGRYRLFDPFRDNIEMIDGVVRVEETTGLPDLSVDSTVALVNKNTLVRDISVFLLLAYVAWFVFVFASSL